MNRSYKIAFVNVDKNTTLCEMTGRDILRRREKKKARQTINLCSTGTIIESSLTVGSQVSSPQCHWGWVMGRAGGWTVNHRGKSHSTECSASARVNINNGARARERERVGMIRTNFVIRPKSNFSSLHNGLVQLCKSKRIASLNAELVERRRIQIIKRRN